MKITVTEKDISEGITGASRLCPVARAMRRDTGDKSISVGVMNWTTRRGKSIRSRFTRRYNLPLPAQRFVARYDAGLPVKTFQFDVDYSGRKR